MPPTPERMADAPRQSGGCDRSGRLLVQEDPAQRCEVNRNSVREPCVLASVGLIGRPGGRAAVRQLSLSVGRCEQSPVSLGGEESPVSVCTRSGAVTRQRCTKVAVEWPGHRVGFGQPMADWPDLPRVAACWTHLTAEERSRYLEAAGVRGGHAGVWPPSRSTAAHCAAILLPVEPVAEQLRNERATTAASALVELAYLKYAMIEATDNSVHPGIRAAVEATDPARVAPTRRQGHAPAPRPTSGRIGVTDQRVDSNSF